VGPARTNDTFAAVDLGSNSFHMVVARLVQDQLHIVDRLRERVALASGLDDKKRLTDDAQARALACIERFGGRVRGMPAENVRAIGTSTLRIARNARSFVMQAQEKLGHPIEIVSGLEEARLIYLGVAHDLSDDSSRRLVIDIGGGSTECILGERFEPLKTDSLHMGCVNWSLRFFRGEVTRESMERARIAARLEVQTMERRYRSLGWEECIGSSGTVLAVEQILRANQWTDGGITEKGLRKLRKALVEIGIPAEFPTIPGLEAERANVIAGGVAILDALFDGLEIERMDVSQGAMREGVIYDLLGRIRHEDVRDKTIRRFMERYQVDMEQAGRVQRTALAQFQQAHEALEIDPSLGQHFLVWSSRLHEIGLSIGYPGYHKHGAYIVEHSDMPGFSREDQVMLAALIEGQRRKFPPARIEALVPTQRRMVERLALLLRLAVMLERSRGQSRVPRIGIEARKSGYMLDFPKGWLDENPLTRADLEQEAARVEPAGFEIAIQQE
jgi:exopolyphosphatase/guanosine-5'-triphosphate,3'-diphosphate pyrophosphatase